MYGFSLTIYLLAGWLANHYPHANPFAYSAGQLWHTLFGLKSNSYINPVHFVSYVLVAGGFLVTAYAWRILYDAQSKRQLTLTGPYAHVRHPQHVGFMLVTLGLLLVWPALSTLTMFPVLVVSFVRLARHEERTASAEFGSDYRRYAASRPRSFLDFV